MTVDTKAISKAFIDARLTHKGLSEFPGTIPSTMAEAYEIQAESIKNWDDSVAGWKIGGVPPELQEKFAAKRLAGPIFKKSVKYTEDGAHTPMPVFADGFAAIEAEFIIELGDVSALPATDLTEEQVKSVINRVFIGVEIASSPLQIINDIGPVGPVSDFGNNAGLIVGPEVKNWADADLSVHQVLLDINEERIGDKCAPEALNGPLGAVKFLIEHLKAEGYEIPVGTYASTGAITGVHQAYSGDKSVIEFVGLGKMSLELIPSDA